MSNNGQTIADRLAAARHVIDGSTVNKAVVKASTHEVQGPKRKHLDYLVTLTGAPNVNLPELANQLVERTRNSSWVVVFKALVTTHHLMCYGNERFLQSCASRLCLFSLQEFQDRSAPAGYDMAVYVRRYSRYLNEKSASYRKVAYDFTRAKRKDDSSQSFKTSRKEFFASMSADNLLTTLPTLQGQIDALIDFQPSTNELTNGVINACFVLLFKDLVRLFACYNDGIINLLQKYFEMRKGQCKDGLEIYKRYLVRMEKIQAFFKVAENVGIDKGDMPDLTSAPSSLLDALQDHLNSLEGKRSGTVSPTTPVSQNEAERVIAEEKRRLEEFARQRGTTNGAPAAARAAPPVTTNQQPDLFGLSAPSVKPSNPVSPVSAQPIKLAEPAVSTPSPSKPASADLLDLDMSGTNTLNNIMAMHTAKQQVQQQQIQQPQPFQQPFGQPSFGMSNPGMANPFGVAPPQQQPMGMGANMGAPNPFAPQMMTQQPAMTSPFGQMNNQMANMNLTSNPFAQPTLAQAQPPMGSNPFANMGGQPATQAMHGGGNRNQQPVNLLD